MAITQSALLSAIADEIQDYGDYDTGTGSFLERQLSKAVEHFGRGCGRGITWPWMIEQSTLTTTAGNKGPYDAPADFDGFMPQKKLHKSFAYDQYGVPPPIEDGDSGQRYPIYRNEADGKLYFYCDPGAANHTLTYLRTANLADLANWPDKQWVKSCLTYYTAFFALHLTEDFAKQAQSMWDLAEALTTKEWAITRRGQSRPDTRTPLDVNGNPAWYSLQGDYR